MHRIRNHFSFISLNIHDIYKESISENNLYLLMSSKHYVTNCADFWYDEPICIKSVISIWALRKVKVIQDC